MDELRKLLKENHFIFNDDGVLKYIRKKTLNTTSDLQTFSRIIELLKNLGLADKVTAIQIENYNLSGDKQLDFSSFINLKKLKLYNTELSVPPIITNCKKLEDVDLTANKLPNESLIHLRLMGNKITGKAPYILTDFPRDEEFSNNIKDFMPQELLSAFVDAMNNMTKLSNLMFPKKVDESSTRQGFSIWTPSAIGSGLANSNYTIDESQINKEFLNLSIVIHEICLTFMEQIKNLDRRKSWQNFIEQRDDPLSYSQMQALLYCAKFYDYCVEPDQVEQLNDLVEEYNEDFLDSNEVWLPNLSFLSETMPSQSAIGKAREQEEHAFPKGLLLPMQYEFWQEDGETDLSYWSTKTKKENKARPTDVSYQITANSISNNNASKSSNRSEVCEDGDYIYAVTLNGGLILEKNIYDHHHSQFRGGQYVVCAGHLKINDGKITDMDNNSGHMCPTEVHLMCAAIYLHNKGLLDENCNLHTVETDEKGKTTVVPKFTVKELIASKDEIFNNLPGILSWVYSTLGMPPLSKRGKNYDL